jgi:O-antigen ligase
VTAPLPVPELSLLPVQSHRTRDNSILYGVTALLLFSALAFGGRDVWALFIFQAAAAVLLAAWIATRVQSNQFVVLSSPLFRPMLAFGTLLCIQLVPRASAYWHATYSQVLLFISYGIICFLIPQTLKSNRQLRVIAKTLIIFGTSVAVFAVVQNLGSPHKLYWLFTPRFGGWIYGPYVNHNHYAGLMEMLFPIPLVFAFSRFAHRRESLWAATASAFMAATIFLSGSRGGMIACFAQLTVFILFICRENRNRRVALFLGAFLLAMLGVIAWTGGHEVTARISTLDADTRSDLATNVRLQIDRDVLKMVRERPVLGWGQGTFADVYPRFRSFYTDFEVNAAHNDFLQVLAETGIAGFAVMVWFLVITIRLGVHKTGKWSSNTNGAVSVAALVGISGIMVHSLVDFNMQIPANAALFYSLCTVAAMEPRFRTHHRGERKMVLNCERQPVPETSLQNHDLAASQ